LAGWFFLTTFFPNNEWKNKNNNQPVFQHECCSCTSLFLDVMMLGWLQVDCFVFYPTMCILWSGPVFSIYCWFSQACKQPGKNQNNKQPVCQWHWGCSAMLAAGWLLVYFSHLFCDWEPLVCVFYKSLIFPWVTTMQPGKKLTINLCVNSIEAAMQCWVASGWLPFFLYYVFFPVLCILQSGTTGF